MASAKTPTKPQLEKEKLSWEADYFRHKAREQKVKADTAEQEHRATQASGDANRQLPFSWQVSTETTSFAIDKLAAWYREQPNRPIEITFNSPGGSVIDGFAFYDHIHQLRSDGATINTAALGYAASMAAVLLQAGETRTIAPNAFMMIHEISAGVLGNFSEIEDRTAWLKVCQEKILDILAERSTLTVDEIRDRWKRKDWWLDAAEAVELGFADRVGP